MKNIYNDCTDIIRELAGNGFLYFDDPVEVKLTPHTPSFHAWGVCVSPDEKLFIMDSQEEWHAFSFEDRNAALLLGSLYQRLQSIRIQYRKAS
jgi:hypothetical protein